MISNDVHSPPSGQERESPRADYAHATRRLSEIIESVAGTGCIGPEEQLPPLGTFPRAKVQLLQTNIEKAFGQLPSSAWLLQCSTLSDLAALESDGFEFNVGDRNATGMLDGGFTPEDLLRGGADEFRMGADPRQRIRIFQQQPDSARDGAGGGFMAADHDDNAI